MNIQFLVEWKCSNDFVSFGIHMWEIGNIWNSTKFANRRQSSKCGLLHSIGFATLDTPNIKKLCKTFIVQKLYWKFFTKRLLLCVPKPVRWKQSFVSRYNCNHSGFWVTVIAFSFNATISISLARCCGFGALGFLVCNCLWGLSCSQLSPTIPFQFRCLLFKRNWYENCGVRFWKGQDFFRKRSTVINFANSKFNSSKFPFCLLKTHLYLTDPKLGI